MDEVLTLGPGRSWGTCAGKPEEAVGGHAGKSGTKPLSLP